MPRTGAPLYRATWSHYQLAWQPVLDAGAETAIAILASPFWHHGPPLALKSDNGSAFIARDTGDLLAAWAILHRCDPSRDPAGQRLVRGCELCGNQAPGAPHALAAAHAGIGQFSAAKQAIQAAVGAGNEGLAKAIHQSLQIFRRREPFRSDFR